MLTGTGAVDCLYSVLYLLYCTVGYVLCTSVSVTSAAGPAESNAFSDSSRSVKIQFLHGPPTFYATASMAFEKTITTRACCSSAAGYARGMCDHGTDDRFHDERGCICSHDELSSILSPAYASFMIGGPAQVLRTAHQPCRTDT